MTHLLFPAVIESYVARCLIVMLRLIQRPPARPMTTHRSALCPGYWTQAVFVGARADKKRIVGFRGQIFMVSTPSIPVPDAAALFRRATNVRGVSPGPAGADDVVKLCRGFGMRGAPRHHLHARIKSPRPPGTARRRCRLLSDVHTL